MPNHIINKKKILFLIAWRYFKTKHNLGAIQIISKISIIGITVSVAALVVVLSVFNGFESLIKKQFSIYQPDIKIIPIIGKKIKVEDNTIQKIKQHPFFKNIHCIVEGKAVLKNDNLQNIVILKGVDSHYLDDYNFKNHLIRGNKTLHNLDTNNIIVGVGIEYNLALDIEKNNTPILLYTPNTNSEFTDLNAGLFSFYVNPISAISLNEKEMDEKIIYSNVQFSKNAFNFKDNEFSYIEINILNKENEFIDFLKTVFNNEVIIQNKYSQNENLFNVIKNEKWIIFFILSLIVLISSFNILGTITMLIINKQKDIQLFQALGLQKKAIVQLFIIEGMILTSMGCIIGLVLGCLICWVQNTFHLVPLNGDFFIINYYPVLINFNDIFRIIFIVYIISFIATIIPAWFAANKNIELKN